MSVIAKDVLEAYDLKKPFVWDFPHDTSSRLIMEFCHKEASISSTVFQNGNLIEVKDYNLTFYSKVSEARLVKLDALPTTLVSPVVNKKIIDILKEICGKDVFQELPVHIKNDPEVKKITPFCNNDYYLINILKSEDVIDLQNSMPKYSTKKEFIIGFNKMRFKSECMSGQHLVRAKNFPPMIVASRELGIVFNKAKIKGIEFYPDFTAFGYYGYENNL